MVIRDGRYERLRLTVVGLLVDAERAYAWAVKSHSPDAHIVSATEDDMDELALLVHELDEAAPRHLRQEIGTDDWRP